MTETLAIDTQLALPYLREQFLLDPTVIFLNHGSFGACPKPVFETYQHWQRELELDPVNFVQRRMPDLLESARRQLARFVGASADQLVFVPNVTYAVNIVAHSIDLRPGDEVIGTNHEYGAVNNTWRYVCEKRGARYVQTEIDLPVTDAHDIVEAVWSRVTERTRVLSISHITSPTALILPIRPLIRRAREAGIISVIDGAHAPGQIDLTLDELGPDYYAGNAHKWLSAPKGSAFLYSREGPNSSLEPLIVSHGWNSGRSHSLLQDNLAWTGTSDPSAYLSIPAAIEFQESNGWQVVREACHRLASQTRREIEELTGLGPVCPDSDEWYSQMFTAFLPDRFDRELRDRLWEQFQIEVPVGRWNDRHTLIRISLQTYNSPQDIDRLLDALETVIRE